MLDVHETVRSFPLQIGDVQVNLISLPRACRENRIHIMSEMGVEDELLNTPTNDFQVQSNSGHTILMTNNNALAEFNTIMDDIAGSINRQVELVAAGGLKVLIATPETFQAIRKANPPPEWAGVYVWWDSTVIYNAEYIKAVLGGDGNFGGNHFSRQEFYEEASHELAESYAGATFFHNDEDTKKYFWQTNLWYIEGLSELLGRHITGLTNEEFLSTFREMTILYPDFSLESLNKGFFLYDKSPVNRNIAYQYCRRFLRHFAPILLQKLREKDINISDRTPYQSVYWILDKAIERYKEGKRESIIDTLEAENILTRAELVEIEQAWVASLTEEL